MRDLAAVVVILLAIGGAARAQDAPPEPTPPAPPPEFVPPELVEFVPAAYPPEAEREGLEAVVLLEILVAVDGTTAEVTVVGPAGHGFDEAAVAAAKQFRWTPGLAKGKPVAVRVTYEYKFTLAEAPPPDGPEGGGLPRPGLISGHVFERGTRVPLGGAGVALVDDDDDHAAKGETIAETTCADDGSFRFADVPAGRYRIIVLVLDHRRGQYVETLAEGEQLTVRYYLERADYDKYQTTVDVAPEREEVERRSIPIEQATKIPGTRGDALRAVENMPGVSRPPLGSGLLVVRGSNPEDTTPYIAGHWVPLIYHFGGITSVVNSDLLERIDYLPGNFSTRYGRAIGGVVNVEVRPPNRERWTGYVDMDVIDAGFLLEGPVGRGSLALAARRSYIDTVFSAVLPDDIGLDFSQAPVYYDYQALYEGPLWGGRLELIGFGVDNRLKFAFGDPAEIDPAFRGAASNHTHFDRIHANWKKSLSPRTDLLVSLAVGYGQIEFELGPALAFGLELMYNSTRLELVHRPFQHVRLVAGVEGFAYPYTIDVKGPRPPVEGEIPGPPSAQEQFESHIDAVEVMPGAYFEAEIDVGGGVTITPGARFDWYRTADEVAVDPRLAARWQRGDHTVRFGLGRFAEPPQPWETNPDFGNPRVDPERATHLTLGYDVQLDRTLRLETTLYYKRMDHLIVRSNDLTMREDGSIRPVAYANEGDGRVYGAEFLLRTEANKKYFGWVSYSLSRSERRDHPDVDPEYRPFMLDQTHILTVVGSMRLPWRLEAGVRFRYVTGNPDTPIVGSIYDADADVYFPIPGESGADRVGAYHQLDIRIDRRWVFDTWMLTAYLDLQNAYNRLSPEGYFYSYDYRERAEITGLPIIPSLGVKGEF